MLIFSLIEFDKVIGYYGYYGILNQGSSARKCQYSNQPQQLVLKPKAWCGWYKAIGSHRIDTIGLTRIIP